MNIGDFFEQLIDRHGAETTEFELKSAQGGLPKNIWETVSAFANTSGGWILLGVRENGERVIVDGVTKPSAMIESFAHLINDPEKISYPASSLSDIMVEQWGAPPKPVITIHVPPAPRSERPVYLHKNPLNSFVRMVSGDKRLSERDVKRMLREASDDASDDLPLPRFRLDDLEIASFRRYRQRFQNRNLGDVRNEYDDRRFLRAIGAWGGDASSEGPTIAGLLMFGTSESIRQWRKRHVIDYRRVSGDPDPQTSIEDRIHWSGNLWDAFEAVYPRLTADLPTPFRLEGPTRIDESYAHRALREALVNLLVHADYAESASSLVERTVDGYRFRNPGVSRAPAELLYSGDHSDARNPRLVDMFRFVGLAEDAGRGVSTMLYSWNQMGYRRPIVTNDVKAYEFSIRFSKSGLFSDDDMSFLNSLGVKLTDVQKMALVLARHGDEVTNTRLCQELGVHSADVTKELRQIRGLGLLIKDGAGRWASYRMPVAADNATSSQLPFILESAQRPLDRKPRPGGSNRRPRNSSGGKQATDIRPQATDTSPRATDIRPQATDTATIVEIPPLSVERRIQPNRLDELIVSFCSYHPMSALDLSTTINRSQRQIARRISSLIKSGRLAYEIPGRPTHPRQRYVADRKI